VSLNQGSLEKYLVKAVFWFRSRIGSSRGTKHSGSVVTDNYKSGFMIIQRSRSAEIPEKGRTREESQFNKPLWLGWFSRSVKSFLAVLGFQNGNGLTRVFRNDRGLVVNPVFSMRTEMHVVRAVRYYGTRDSRLDQFMPCCRYVANGATRALPGLVWKPGELSFGPKSPIGLDKRRLRCQVG
jgi:hypothetical protein